MQQESKWTPAPDAPRNYMSTLQYPYNSSNEYSPHHHPNTNSHSNALPGITTQPMTGLISGSQPGTPRPDMISPPPDNNELFSPSSNATTSDLIRRRPPLPSRPASFTTTTFHSNPYPGSVSIRRRRTTESSMFSFETGPSFSQTKQIVDLWNIDQSNGYQVQLHAKMDRGFFRADQDWTCYRRNYFQVSATFDVHGINYLMQGPEVPCLLRTENQEIYQVDFFSIGVSARVTGSDKKIELVQHTPKRDKGPQIIPEARVISAGGNLHLASVGSNHNIVSFERMQFKTATANNGKRRAAQQYYEIVVDLCANTSTGKQFKVASCTSAPLVVRGRSPGHYADSHTRYRNMDAGTPPTMSPSFGGPLVGQGTSSGSTTSSTNPTSSATGSEDHHYMQSQPPPPPPPRFGANPLSAPPPPHNHGSDFGHSYSSYDPQSPGYPYHHPAGPYAHVLNSPPISSGLSGRNNENDGSSRDYMMHPYASHHPSSAAGPGNYEPGYYESNHPHDGSYHNNNESKSYWPAGRGGEASSQQGNDHHMGGRYNGPPPSHHPTSYVNSEFNGYNNNSIRPPTQQPSSNEDEVSSETARNPLDAGRSMTPDNKHFMHHSSAPNSSH